MESRNKLFLVWLAFTIVTASAAIIIIPGPAARFGAFSSGGGGGDGDGVVTNYSGLVAWWKADSYSLADGTLVFGSTADPGTNIWTDQSGNGHHIDNASADPMVRATFKTNIFGTQPALAFFGAGNIGYITSGFDLTGNFTVLVVGKDIGDFTSYYWIANNATDEGLAMNALCGNNFVYAQIDGNTLSPSDTFTTAVTDGRLMTFQRSGSTLTFFENGGTNRSGGTLSGTLDCDFIGAFGDYYFAEMVVYSAARTSGEIHALYTNYFKPKWGLP